MLSQEKQVEELLEALWTDPGGPEIKAKASLTSPHQEQPLLEEQGMGEALRLAEQEGLVEANGESLRLTASGKSVAMTIVRRHRLAERLFHDVLDVGGEEAETSACKFEHVLSPDAADSICILLGHPTVCPHGKPIPGGDCCGQRLEQGRPLVMPATQLRPGEEATVAYLGVRAGDSLDHLSAMGL